MMPFTQRLEVYGPVIRRLLATLAGVALAGLPALRAAETISIREASGIVRRDDTLLLVDDSQNGVYFRFELKGESGPVLALSPDRLTRVLLPQASMAADLEAINILADGRVIVLSERLRAVFDEKGMIADYAAPLAEFGKRGLEGLAVRRFPAGRSRVAVLWEGGYPEYMQVLEQLRRRVGRRALQPMIQVHDLNPGERDVQVQGSNLILLDVPVPKGREPRAQRFRAPDLVWHTVRTGQWGFIVLLSSRNSAGPLVYQYHWLQRFDLRGQRIGKPIDLDNTVGGELAGVNWEGLCWFEEGESLALVHESHPKPDAVVYILPLPKDWKPTGRESN